MYGVSYLKMYFHRRCSGTDGVVHVEVLNNMLQNQWKALLAYAIVGVWQVAGYYLIIYLNGLNNISGGYL